MGENKRIRLFSYNKVWKFEHKIYAIEKWVLPVPIAPYDLLYFIGTIVVVAIIGKIFPFIKILQPVIRYVAVPYGMMKFLTKMKLDGKNPIKYFCGYLYYIFFERGIYLEKLRPHTNRKEEKLVLDWSCSRGRKRIVLTEEELSSLKAREKKEEMLVCAAEGTPDQLITETPSDAYRAKRKRIAKISSGPKLKQVADIPAEEDEEIESLEVELEDGLSLSGKIGNIYDIAASKLTELKIKERIVGATKQMSDRVSEIKNSRSAGEPDELTADSTIVVKSSPDTRKIKMSKEEKPPALNNITMVIAVCSLTSGTGCTHIARSLAYYIKNGLKRTVCIIDNTNIAEGTVNGIEVFQWGRFYDLYDQYNYIILDAGKYDITTKREVKPSQIKVMCCINQEEYMMMLADFIRTEESAKKWRYIFNHVPANMEKQVDERMEEYEHWCYPVTDAMNFDKNTTAMFNRLIKGDKL